MSLYDWPAAQREEEGDDPGARGRFTRRSRIEFDADGAREAGRKALHGLSKPKSGGAVMRAPVTGTEFIWQPLGPMTVVKGQAIGGPRVAGRVNMMAVHPTSDRLYAASGNGGVWFSDNGGGSWSSLGGLAITPLAGINRPAQRNACGSITVDFGATAADDKVYVGTGETTEKPNAQPGIALGGIGVLVADHPATSLADDPWVREAKNLVGEGVCRIALQPGGAGVVAATTAGLFERPPGGGKDCDWQKVSTPPFNTLSDKCSDVLWTRGDATHFERLWVWVQSGAKAGLWVRDAGAAAFVQVIAVPVAKARRAVMSQVDPKSVPDQFYVLNDSGGNVAPLLFRVRCADKLAPVATPVAGVPQIMGGQGFYDIAVATHPTLPDRVVIGGKTFAATTPDGVTLKASGNTNDGAVVVADVAMNGATLTFGFPSAFTMVGVGVHADVHDVVWTHAGSRMWVGCDGGVFRSDHPAQQVGFYSVNSGLAVIESNYLACHPLCEGHIVTGLQDNGVISRHSGYLWDHVGDGDGGGVAFDPVKPDRFLRQYFNGRWGSSDGTLSLPVTAGERDAAAFYSMAAAIAHRRGVAANVPPNVQQVIVGTTRVWYTEDFGTNWFTLPSGTSLAVANPNVGLDTFGEAVTVCRWQSPDVAWVLGERKLMRYARVPGSDAGGAPGNWAAQEVRPVDVVPTGKEKKRPPVPPSMNDAPVWTDVAVNLDPPLAADQPPTQRGTLGAVYVGTIGKVDTIDVDTLYWFDGTDHWYPTNLRKDPKGAPAPVTAIVCHPEFPNEVWVGTTVGVWRGVRTDHAGAAPTWKWEGRVNGLPEAAVEDLQIYKNGNLMLLRAAIAARGVWELRLDMAELQTRTYLRAHDDDLRHRDQAVDKKRDLVTPRSWHGSPDVRPRLAALSRPAPPSLPWTQATPNINVELLRRFQSALRSFTGDLRIQPTGRWDGYFNEVLRDLRATLIPAPPPPPPPALVSLNKALWDKVMVAPHATAEPWGSGVPTEADLVDYAGALVEGDIGKASCSMPNKNIKVDIVVHHRGQNSVDGANVRVTLLKWVDPKTKKAAKWDDHATWFSGNVPWSGAVNDVLNSAGGTTSKSFADGWKFVGTVATRRRTLAGQTLDATHPGVATFDLDLSGLKKNTLVLLVAVIRTGTGAADDIALTATNLEDLAMKRHNVAVRSIRIDA